MWLPIGIMEKLTGQPSMEQPRLAPRGRTVLAAAASGMSQKLSGSVKHIQSDALSLSCWTLDTFWGDHYGGNLTVWTVWPIYSGSGVDCRFNWLEHEGGLSRLFQGIREMPCFFFKFWTFAKCTTERLTTSILTDNFHFDRGSYGRAPSFPTPLVGFNSQKTKRQPSLWVSNLQILSTCPK